MRLSEEERLQQDGSQPVALTTKGQSMHKTLLAPSIPCDENEEMAANFLFSVTVVAACDSAGRPASDRLSCWDVHERWVGKKSPFSTTPSLGERA